MRKIKCGRLYNTATAKKIYTRHYEFTRGFETLFETKSGRHFLHVCSDSPCNPEYEDIHEMTPQQTLEWLEEHCPSAVQYVLGLTEK